MTDLSKQIRASMAYTGLTQEDVAEKVGISRATLCRKLADPSRFTWGELLIIGKLFRWEMAIH